MLFASGSAKARGATLRALLLTTTSLLIACSAGGGRQSAIRPERPSSSERADEPSTLDGLFTPDQADRGEALHRNHCSECHESSDWTSTAFRDRWSEASVFRLWHWIYGRMPHGNPGSLERQEVSDALAYILELNGLPPGASELSTDDDWLDDYWVIWPSPPGQDRGAGQYR